MSVRKPLLLICVLLLAIPIVCWQAVKHFEASARQARINSQSLLVSSAKHVLAESAELNSILNTSRTPYKKNDLYAERANFPLFVDGYDDDWLYLRGPTYRFRNADDQVEMHLATRRNELFLFISVKDNIVRYHKPPLFKRDLAEGETNNVQAVLVNGDSIDLQIIGADGNQLHIIFRSEAPGPVVGVVGPMRKGNLQVGRRMFRYKGFWSATQDGFQLELSMPLPQASTAFGISFVDIDSPEDSRDQILGTLNYNANQLLGNLFYASSRADLYLKPWVTQGSRARLFDRQGRLLSDINALYEKTDKDFEYNPAKQGLLNAVLYRIFAAFISDGDVANQPFRLKDGLHLPYSDLNSILDTQSRSLHYQTNERDTVIGTLATIGATGTDGFILFESNEKLASAYASSSSARLLCSIALMAFVLGFVLLLFQTIPRLAIL